MEKWRGESTRPEQKVIPVVTVSFRASDKQQDKRNHSCRGVRMAGQPFSIQRDGILTVGFSSLLVNMSSSCFISSGKACPDGSHPHR